jgi:hypothetical protein
MVIYMSMIGNYRRITSEYLSELQNNSDALASLISSDKDSHTDSTRYLNIEKTWHAIHLLLTGSDSAGEYPLRKAVLGGELLSSSYDILLDFPICFLMPCEVQEVAHALSQISSSELRERFDPLKLAAASIYPRIWWNRGADMLDSIVQYYSKLVRFFQDAARFNNAILFYIT